MTNAVLEREAIQALIDAAGEQLAGDWVLVGGALVALWFSPNRATEDVDLVSVRGGDEQRYELMRFATDRGMPLEAVNSAADFFLRRIPGWEAELEVLHRGPRATILRPSPTLFLLLKIDRMSEADLEDCLALVAHAEVKALALDTTRVVAALDRHGAGSEGEGARRENLRVRLGG